MKTISKIQNKEIHFLVHNTGLHSIPFQLGKGWGDYFVGFDDISTGSDKWNRMSNKIVPIGLRLNFNLKHPALPSTYDNGALIPPLLVNRCKVIVFQYLEALSDSNSTPDYRWFKQEVDWQGTTYINQLLMHSYGNNSGDRPRFNVVYEKNFELSPPTVFVNSSATPPIFTGQTFNYQHPSQINVVKFIKGKS